MTVQIFSSDLSSVRQFFEQAPGLAIDAADSAMDTVARRGITRMKKEVLNQLEFPSGYLDDKITISRKLRWNDGVEVVITGRDRPTSLARFAPGAQPGSKARVVVRVKKGGKATMMSQRVFPVRLRSGATENGNVGLAVRLKPGESMKNSQGAVEVKAWAGKDGSRVFLLYGPSVDQALGEIGYDQLALMSDDFMQEFIRQFTWKGFK